MRCRKIEKRLSALVDGELREKEKNIILAHLKSCLSCKQKAKKLFSLQAFLEEGKEAIQPSPYFLNKLEQRIAQLEQEKTPFRKLLQLINRASVPATISAVLIIGSLVGNHLGDVLYSKVANLLNPTDSSTIQESIAQSLSVNALEDFPPESLGGVYIGLISENKSSPSR